jgi:hypothetical protein
MPWAVGDAVMNLTEAAFGAGDGIEVAIEQESLMVQARFVFLGVLWVLWNALPSPTPPHPPPRTPYRVTVRTAPSREVLYQVGGFHGNDALDAAQAYADEIRRIGVDDWIFKKTHSWRID